jgi:hypothetical protein
MRSKLACLVLVLVAVACGESRERVGSNHPDGALGGGGVQGSGGAMASSDSAGGSTALAGSTNPAGGASAGGTTSPGGSLATSSASGGTGPGGAGGRGGSAGATTPTGGSTLSPDAGAGTGGKPQPDAGTPGLDGPTQPDTPLVTNPDAATGGADTRRADTSADGQLTFCHSTTTGCMCTAIPSTEPSVPVCNNDNQDETRLNRCCAASAYCACDVLACASESSTGRCQCDFESLLSRLPPTWTKAAQCPTPAAGFKCCLHAKESYCTCKQQECTDGSTQVANCALSDLATCAASETAVDNCM